MHPVADVHTVDVSDQAAHHVATSRVARPLRLPGISMFSLGLFVALARWMFSRNRVIFHVAPDEAATFAMSRWIAGGTPWNMFDHATWRPGLSTLIAPIHWFTDQGSAVFHGALIVNAALAGVSSILLATLAMRLTVMSRSACIVSSGIIAVSASSLSATAYAWGESLVTLTFLATLWYLLKFYDDRQLRHGFAAIAWSVAGLTSHSRMTPLVILATLVVLANTVVRAQWRRSAKVAGFAAGAIALSYGFVFLVIWSVWDAPGKSNSIGTIWVRLDDPISILESALGQLWYQMVTTLAIFGVGMLAVARRSVLRGRIGSDARVLLFITVPMLAMSVVFMSGRSRSDHRIYGRYNDAIVWPILIIGIGWLVGLAKKRDTRSKFPMPAVTACAIALCSTAVGVYFVDGKALRAAVGVRPMVAGLVPFVGMGKSINVLLLSGIALGGFLVLLVLCRRPGPRSIGLLVVVLGVVLTSGLRTHDGLSLRLNTWEKASAVLEIEDGIIPPGADIGVRFVLEKDEPAATWDDQRRRAQLYQFYLPGHRFSRDTGIDDNVGPYVFAPLRDKTMVAGGAKLLWSDPNVQVGLWLEPTAG